MDVIARDECPTHGLDYGRPRIEATGERFCQRRGCRKLLATVEYVPRGQLEGAVEERDKLVADLRGLADRLASIGADQAAEEVGALITAYGGR